MVFCRHILPGIPNWMDEAMLMSGFWEARPRQILLDHLYRQLRDLLRPDSAGQLRLLTKIYSFLAPQAKFPKDPFAPDSQS